MSGTLIFLTMLVVGAVFAVLFLGLWNMSRGAGPETSQKFMQWRVMAQFLAIIVLLLIILFTR